MPAISILTISLNQKAFLASCIDSIRGQAFEDYEHIVIDPGSTDGSRELVAAYADRRLRLLTDYDNGPAQGLNHGIAAAAGKVVLYLNADDELAPGALEAICEFHSDRPEVDFLIGDGWTIDECGRPIRFVRSDRFRPLMYALGMGVVLQQATSIKMQLFVNGLSFNESNRINWDAELLFDSYAMGSRMAYMRAPLGYFRLQAASITMSANYKKRLKAESLRLHRTHLPGIPPVLTSVLSYPVRAAKKFRNVLTGFLYRPRFPGLSRPHQ